jgi:SAM-dependent MidA family methyltransferase
MSLTEIIIQRIRSEGLISFRDFMEMALYYPDQGYYTSPREKIGTKGDYYTSPFLTGLFGHLIAKQLEEMWLATGRKEFTVVEYGAGTGALCNDILNALKNNLELYDNLRYCIIERSEVMREKEKLIGNEKLSWYQHINEIPMITGCIFFNEVLDNFPVHQVIMQDELMEVFVDYNNGFIEVLQPAPESLKNYLEELQVVLPKGFRTEINLLAIEGIRDIASALKKGFVLTIDYGFTSSELYSNKRSSGTLVCYYKHSVNYCPYINIGDQDITAHINFSALHHWGIKNGLASSGFTNQASFLLSLGLNNCLYELEEKKDQQLVTDQQKAILIHTFLMDMGKKFKVLIQEKDMGHPHLSGLQFATKNIF